MKKTSASLSPVAVYFGLVLAYTALSCVYLPKTVLDPEPYADILTNFIHHAKETGFKSLCYLDYGYLALPQRLLALIAWTLTKDTLLCCQVLAVIGHLGVALLGFMPILKPFAALIPSLILRSILCVTVLSSLDYETRLFINFAHLAYLPLFMVCLMFALKLPVSSWCSLTLAPMILAKPFSITLLPMIVAREMGRIQKLFLLLMLFQAFILLSNSPDFLRTDSERSALEFWLYFLQLKSPWVVFVIPGLYKLGMRSGIRVLACLVSAGLMVQLSFAPQVPDFFVVYRHTLCAWCITQFLICYLLNGRLLLLCVALTLEISVLRQGLSQSKNPTPLITPSQFSQYYWAGFSEKDCIPINPWPWLSKKACLTNTNLQNLQLAPGVATPPKGFPLPLKLPYIQYRKGILVFAKGGNKPVPVTILLNQSEIQVRSSLIWIHAQPTHLIYIPCGEDPAEIRLLPKQELAFYQEEDGPQVVTLSLP